MIVQSIMTTPVVTVGPTASVREAARLMLEKRISGLPVEDSSGQLVGILSESDLLRRSELGTTFKRAKWLEFFVSPGKAASEYTHANGRLVEEVMSTEVITISSDAPLHEAVETMMRHGIKRLPAVKNGRLVGIIARSDLLCALERAMAAVPSSQTLVPDEEIRENVEAKIAAQPWSADGLIRIGVSNGVVELEGTILDERQRMAARVAAENVQGVKSVTDRMTWVEPMSGMVLAP